MHSNKFAKYSQYGTRIKESQNFTHRIKLALFNHVLNIIQRNSIRNKNYFSIKKLFCDKHLVINQLILRCYKLEK